MLGQRVLGLAEGGVGLLGAALAAVGGRLGRRALLQLLDALSEPDKAEIVERGWLEPLVLAGEGGFQQGLRLAELARAEAAGCRH